MSGTSPPWSGSLSFQSRSLRRSSSFVLRFRRSLGEERQQLRWVGGSLGFGVCLGAIGAFTWGVFPYAYVLYSIALLALPVGTAVAVLRYRLYELDLVVNRAFVYGVMTIAVVASYVLVVGVIGATLSDRGNLRSRLRSRASWPWAFSRSASACSGS